MHGIRRVFWAVAGLGDRILSYTCLSFKLNRADVSNSRMTADRIIEAVNVFEHISSSEPEILPCSSQPVCPLRPRVRHISVPAMKPRMLCVCHLEVFASSGIVKTHPTLTPPKIGGFALIMLRFEPFWKGHLWTQNATPCMLIFLHEINKLARLRRGVNVECVFTL